MAVYNLGPNREYKFHMDGYLVANLDSIMKNVRKDYDAFILFVGREGYGKSTLALQCASYCDPTFNLDRVVFTAEQFIDAVNSAEPYQAIVFDETMGYLNSRGAMSKFNKTLIKIMSEMRSKNLIVFLCIPNFFMMDWYVAQHRSTGMVLIKKRGEFHSYGYISKKKLYMKGKKHHSYCVAADYYGRFVKAFPVDKEAYEEKKKQAIAQWESDGRKSELSLKQRDDLIRWSYEEKGAKTSELAKILGLSVRQVQYIVK